MRSKNILIVLLVLTSVMMGCPKSRTSVIETSGESEKKNKERVGPPGILPFHVYKVEYGDSFFELFGPSWKIVSRINRVSPKGLKPGMKLLVPEDLERAKKEYLPLRSSIDTSVELVIDLEAQVLGRYEEGDLKKWYPISSGKEGYRTPTGKFRISRKSKFYRSKSYPKPDGGAFMPYAMNFYRGYWIHGGTLPGEPASHGCVRLMRKEAKKLFHNIQIGDRVWVK